MCSLPFMSRHRSDFLFTLWELWIINSAHRHPSAPSCNTTSWPFSPAQPRVDCHTHLEWEWRRCPPTLAAAQPGRPTSLRVKSVAQSEKSFSGSKHCFSSCPTGFGIERLCAVTGRRPEGLPHLQACDPISIKNGKSHGREISPRCSGRASEPVGVYK